MLSIQEVKKKLGINNTDISRMFGYKNMLAYANSSSKDRIEQGIIEMYKLMDTSSDTSRYLIEAIKYERSVTHTIIETESLIKDIKKLFEEDFKGCTVVVTPIPSISSK